MVDESGPEKETLESGDLGDSCSMLRGFMYVFAARVEQTNQAATSPL